MDNDHYSLIVLRRKNHGVGENQFYYDLENGFNGILFTDKFVKISVHKNYYDEMKHNGLTKNKMIDLIYLITGESSWRVYFKNCEFLMFDDEDTTIVLSYDTKIHSDVPMMKQYASS